jgi:hypothetical protein
MRSSSGQAGIEALIVLPLLLVIAVLGVQAMLWAVAAVEAGAAASAGARAEQRGDDPQAAALRALPRALRPGARIVVRPGGDVRVSVRAPSLVPRLRPLRFAGDAR